MKLNEALQKAVREFGVNILQEKRLAALLSDYRAFDDLREMREVIQAVPDDPHTKEICSLAAEDGDPDYREAADGLRNSLREGKHFRKELADLAADGILFALGVGKTSDGLPAEVPADAGTAKAAVTVSAAPAGAEASAKGRSGKGGLLFWRTLRLSLILPLMLLSPSFWGDFLAVLLWCAAFSVCWPLSCLFGENYFRPLGILLGYIASTWAVKSSYAERLTARLGDTEAMTRLGNRYCSGKGVRQDFDEAAKWYRKALWKGSAEARCGLGLMYLSGKGVVRDTGKALKWLQESADLGFAGAMKSLGDMYAGGDGVPQDDEAAADWYRNAAEHGSADAEYIMGEMYSEGRLVPAMTGWLPDGTGRQRSRGMRMRSISSEACTEMVSGSGRTRRRRAGGTAGPQGHAGWMPKAAMPRRSASSASCTRTGSESGAISRGQRTGTERPPLRAMPRLRSGSTRCAMLTRFRELLCPPQKPRPRGFRFLCTERCSRAQLSYILAGRTTDPERQGH